MWSGERIRQLRLRLGWSAAEISRRLGMTTEQFKRIEAGESSLGVDTLQQLEV